jgi:hypothetical protein
MGNIVGQKVIMPKVSDITAVTITIEAGEKQVLFVLLDSGGSINRLGTGTADNKEHDLFIGVSSVGLLSELKTHLSDEMLQYMGGYDVPERRGVPCRLSIGLMFADGEQNGFEFNYGSKSTGPPPEITEFVVAAVNLTDP